MRITILGSGTSTGVPMAGCSCAICKSRNPKNSRTRCSVLISHFDRNILIDTSTDLRQQALREGITRIDAVLYTHTHADHLHGIDDLRPFNLKGGGAIPIFSGRSTIAFIRRAFSYIFDEAPEPGYRPHLATFPIGGPFSLFSLPVVPIPLLHGRGHSLGYRLGSFAYLTDCSAIPPESESRLHGLDLLIIDALRFTPHSTHFNIPQAIEAASRLRPRRTLLTHLSHEVDHERHTSGLPDGIEFAYDGQVLQLPHPGEAA